MISKRYSRVLRIHDGNFTVEKCKHAGKHTAKKKPRKSLTYKAFESVLAVWTTPVETLSISTQRSASMEGCGGSWRNRAID